MGAVAGKKTVAGNRLGTRRTDAGALEDIAAGDGVYIGNAGMVLVHPFLPRLFDALGIAAQGRLIRPERALCLLHYLTTGETTAPEYELILPKILCNAPLKTPVEREVELTAAELNEADALLEAVIRHWEVLQNTSPDGLRSPSSQPGTPRSGRALAKRPTATAPARAAARARRERGSAELPTKATHAIA